MRSEAFEARAALIAAALLLTGCAAADSGASTAGAVADGRTDPALLKAKGEAVRCIPSRNNVSTQPAGDNVLMFRSGVNSWFRNDLRAGCPAMRADRPLLFPRAGSQYCELDTFQVVDQMTGANFGFCSLGRFTPVEVPRGTRF